MKRKRLVGGVLVGVTVCAALVTSVFGAGVPRPQARSFDFPVSFANGVSGNLVLPSGTTSPLMFQSGEVAIGELPVPMPFRPTRGSRRGHGASGRDFVRVAEAGPHARLLLSGVVNAAGAVTNSGNQLIIDAVVSPSAAVVTPPPFVIPFDIIDGKAFIDAPLPIHPQTDGAVRVQVLGVTVVDPDGQPFGVLGFALRPAATPPQPTPVATPASAGQCFVGPDCSGASFPSSHDQCCQGIQRPDSNGAVTTSWCPPEQFDPSTGRCMAEGCVACPAPSPVPDCPDRATCAGRCAVQCPDGLAHPGVCRDGASCSCSASCDTPTPGPGTCADQASCGGACTVVCADGTTVAGTCVGGHDERCACSAACTAPTPCGVGQCFDTITGQCTGRTCGHGLSCPLANQLCDVSGQRCPCTPPPPPAHGRICCQCSQPSASCIDFRFVEAQPICPPGCQTLVGQECDAASGECVAPLPCSSDADCNDGNGCTTDRCTPDGCTHDCVCVGPLGCGPGPQALQHGMLHRPH